MGLLVDMPHFPIYLCYAMRWVDPKIDIHMYMYITIYIYMHICLLTICQRFLIEMSGNITLLN